MTLLSVCRGPQEEFRKIRFCPVCEQRRRFVLHFGGWWGNDWTCCGCGDRWDENGALLERPFARGWRQRSIAAAKERYAAALPAAAYAGVVEAFVERLRAPIVTGEE